MAVTDQPWDGSAARFQDDQWARSCVLDLADCSESARGMHAKMRYKLPIREPGGAINANALGAASAALAGARSPLKACPAAKTAAAKRLLAAYRQAGMTAPDSLKQRVT